MEKMDRLDLAVAKCVIGERSVSIATYEKIIKDLIEEVERLDLDLNEANIKPSKADLVYENLNHQINSLTAQVKQLEGELKT